MTIAFVVTGKVTKVKSTGYATRNVEITDNNGGTHIVRIVKSMLAFAIDNSEYRNESHELIDLCAWRDSNPQPSDLVSPRDMRCPCRDMHDLGDCPFGCTCGWCAPELYDDEAFWTIVAECQDAPDTESANVVNSGAIVMERL